MFLLCWWEMILYGVNILKWETGFGWSFVLGKVIGNGLSVLVEYLGFFFGERRESRVGVGVVGVCGFFFFF